jgi:hypothetical protein
VPSWRCRAVYRLSMNETGSKETTSTYGDAQEVDHRRRSPIVLRTCRIVSITSFSSAGPCSWRTTLETFIGGCATDSLRVERVVVGGVRVATGVLSTPRRRGKKQPRILPIREANRQDDSAWVWRIRLFCPCGGLPAVSAHCIAAVEVNRFCCRLSRGPRERDG